jgi:type I restriction enzyme R subunit
VEAARAWGPGHRYLIQHSAASGKTNNISWLTHRLSVLHDEANKPVFDSVLVITDRNVLDAQLQEAIRQIDRTPGVVAADTVAERRLSDACAHAAQSLWRH